MDGSTVDYYVVRIYRKAPAGGAEGRALVGMVEMAETAGGQQRAFHTIEELWQILGERPTAQDDEAKR